MELFLEKTWFSVKSKPVKRTVFVGKRWMWAFVFICHVSTNWIMYTHSLSVTTESHVNVDVPFESSPLFFESALPVGFGVSWIS